VVYALSIQNFSNSNTIVIITFIINGVIILINLTNKGSFGYSLDDMFWVFSFIFMFIAPLLQYLNNHFPWWGQTLITDEVLILSNISVMIFNLFYILIRKITLTTTQITKKEKGVIKNINFILSTGYIISVLVSLYIIQNVGFLNLFSRGTASLNLDQASMLIVSKSLRAFPFVTLIINLLYKNKHGKFYKKHQFITVAILFVLTHFPTGLPRYQIATVYIALFIVVFKNIKNKYLFKGLIFVGLLALFPLMGMFRSIGISMISGQQLLIPNPIDDLLKADYDAFSMLSRSIIYTDMKGLTFGKQLIGALLFFIPRRIWPSKPIGSGSMMAHYFGWPFTNASCPFIGEAYINFGALGILIFSISLAIFTSKLDKKFEFYSKNSSNISVLKIYYPILLGFLFFILRGDLLSSFAYAIGYFLPVLFLYVIDKILCGVSPKVNSSNMGNNKNEVK
jgi:oligosaccharide repeat unit polymerase